MKLSQPQRILQVQQNMASNNISRLDAVELPSQFTSPANFLIKGLDDGSGVILLVGDNVHYLGNDPDLIIAFREDSINGWRPLVILKTTEPTKILQQVDEFLGLTEKSLVPSVKTSSDTEEFGRDLVESAISGNIKSPLFREAETAGLIRILSKMGKNAGCLVGFPGVGKTAVVEGLAVKIARGEVPASLRNAKILDVNLAFLAAGAQYKNEFEGKFKKLLDLVRNNHDYILFLDEIHLLCSEQNDISQMIKADLGRGNIRLIGATTHTEFRIIAEDPALARRFQVIPVNELSSAQTVEILQNIRPQLERHHQISIEEETLQLVVDLSVRYLHERKLPDIAIDLLDEAAAYESTISTNGVISALSSESIYSVLSLWCGIPKNHFSASGDLTIALAELPGKLQERIFGQEQAIAVSVNALRRSLILNVDQPRPRAVLLFVGPSGVGKTELATAIAQTFYGDSKFLKRIDLTEFNSEHTIARLVGAPPGYVGYGKGGELVNALKEHRHGVLLLDEIEKAHPKILTESLLTLLGEGILHDMNTGEMVDARNWLVIMTSNLGTNQHLKPGIGIREVLPHEFLGRIDEIIEFQRLSIPAIMQICKMELEKLNQKLIRRFGNVKIDISDAAYNVLIEQMLPLSGTQGARVVRKIFQKQVSDRCLQFITNSNDISDGLLVQIDININGEIELN